MKSGEFKKAEQLGSSAPEHRLGASSFLSETPECVLEEPTPSNVNVHGEKMSQRKLAFFSQRTKNGTLQQDRKLLGNNQSLGPNTTEKDMKR